MENADVFRELLSEFLDAFGGSDDQDALREHQLQHEMYEGWRKIVYDNQSGLRDYWRISDETKDLEREIQQLDAEGNVRQPVLCA